MNRIYFIGQPGSDAGSWYIGSDGKIHHIPGWNPEAMVSVKRTVEIVGIASGLQMPEGREKIVSASFSMLAQDLKGFVEPGSIIVLQQR